MLNFLIVGTGGALGAAGRYLISLLPLKTEFPVLTLLTNFGGAVLIGFVMGLFMENGIRERWLLCWKTGVCGGFTTFSTFSLEAFNLFQNGRSVSGGIYVVFSVVLCLLGVALGRFAAARVMR